MMGALTNAPERIASLLEEISSWKPESSEDMEEAIWVLFAYLTAHAQARGRDQLFLYSFFIDHAVSMSTILVLEARYWRK